MSYTDISNVYLYGLGEDKNYPVTTVSVAYTDGGFAIGDVLDSAGALVISGTESDASYILIDERLGIDDYFTDGTSYDMKVLWGYAGVGSEYVQADSGATFATAQTALEAKGFKFESQLSA